MFQRKQAAVEMGDIVIPRREDRKNISGAMYRMRHGVVNRASGMVEACAKHSDVVARCAKHISHPILRRKLARHTHLAVIAMPSYYFAYGSNMSKRQMAERCPGAKPMGVARLNGWRFIINQIGAAALADSEGDMCFGVLWKCHARHIADLDRYESVKQGVYTRQEHRMYLGPRQIPVKGVVYIATDQIVGAAPIPGYVENAILPGAEEFGLPETYQSALRTWLPGGTSYADPSIRRKSTFRFGRKKARKFTGWGGQR